MLVSICFRGQQRMLIQAGKLTFAAVFAVMLGLSPTSALLVGAGQSATIDFDFSGSQAAIDSSAQPLTMSIVMTNSVIDQFDDPSGLISFQYLDIGAGSTVNLGYDATGGADISRDYVLQYCNNRSGRESPYHQSDGKHRSHRTDLRRVGLQRSSDYSDDEPLSAQRSRHTDSGARDIRCSWSRACISWLYRFACAQAAL